MTGPLLHSAFPVFFEYQRGADRVEADRRNWEIFCRPSKLWRTQFLMQACSCSACCSQTPSLSLKSIGMMRIDKRKIKGGRLRSKLSNLLAGIQCYLKCFLMSISLSGLTKSPSCSRTGCLGINGHNGENYLRRRRRGVDVQP